MASRTPVYLEVGKTWVFASAVEWPGWCRRGKGEEGALEVLRSYEPRYRKVAGASFKPGQFDVVGRLEGGAGTDFGAPGAIGTWEYEPLNVREAKRLVTVLGAAWKYFDTAGHEAPASLRKGPRGGGRDRDAIIEHVSEAERAYPRKVEVRLPPRTPWPEQRASISEARTGPPTPAAGWPQRYACRRIAWHVLDHAWEMEDRS